ncbi:hypothetical protein FJD32_019620 [Shewanella sp. LC6]|uniref:Uncharacterized protein n=1 Tax=Shewanella xiamenensis TaxID=332186 RepID=A0AAW6R1V9_9GAMM|nr:MULTISPECIES: hypothetical protein [Shewanella]ASF15745.1 hypothetical protein CEQ32_12675 [Shewanella sp. FDAARGOS_354]MDG5901810.1 hypothetical protein [Shewanella xiamenensis]MDH1625807.1 hypothetical protein [Shewanella xiamenensis]PWH04647.1 hypothetical protein DIY08_02390 [Shewanella xiamenensis]QQK62228.1 hypothetical protein FJD32_019620 [Shewanella sp. LC6]
MRLIFDSTGQLRRTCLFGGILSALLALPTFAGQVVVTRSDKPFDAFAVRDQVLKDNEWQESLRRQEQIQILQALPLGCIVQMQPYRYFRCGQDNYRPYRYQQQDVYIKVDPPAQR